MTYRTIFPERAQQVAELLRDQGETFDPHPGHTEPAHDPGPGVEIFRGYRQIHGAEPCPGQACKVHGGPIAVRQVVVTAAV